MTEHDVQDDYPFVSPCGIELNFIRPAATPIVYHTFRKNDRTLLYGGNLEQEFDSTILAISRTTGRLYHRFIPKNAKEDIRQHGGESMAYGLIRSSVAVALSEKIGVGADGGFLYDETHEIDWLPEENEPGGWAMPNDEIVG